MSANFDDQFNSLNSTLETNSNNTTLALNQLQQNVSTQFSQMQSTNNAKLLEVKSELLNILILITIKLMIELIKSIKS